MNKFLKLFVWRSIFCKRSFKALKFSPVYPHEYTSNLGLNICIIVPGRSNQKLPFPENMLMRYVWIFHLFQNPITFNKQSTLHVFFIMLCFIQTEILFLFSYTQRQNKIDEFKNEV